MTRTDQQLIQDVVRGRVDAFEILYRRYRDWVHRLAWRITGDEDLALDVLQETFAYLVRKLPALDLTAKLTTFLYPAVRHLALNALRDRQRATGSDQDLAELAVASPESRTLALDDLTQVLAQLPREQRQIVLMRFVDDMTIPDIAGALGIPTGTAKSRLHHALKALRTNAHCRHYFLD